MLHVAEHLDVPLRGRDELLLAAGYAPEYGQTDLDAPEMAAVRDALDLVLGHAEPFPALVVDRHWDLVRANAGLSLLLDGVDPRLLAPPVNVLRVSLHPDGIAGRLEDLPAYSAHVLVVLRTRWGRLSFLTTAARFGTAADVTLAELTIESFFPADAETSERVRAARG